jgi:hypothetical protein
MHHGYDPKHWQDVATFLGIYYVALSATNGGAALYLWKYLARTRDALVWLAVAFVFAIAAAFAFGGSPFELPEGFIHTANQWLTGNPGAIVYTVGTTAALVVLFVFRKFFVQPTVAWTLLNVSLLFMGLAMTNKPFWDIVTKPDNVPIVMLVYLLGFFTWLAAYKAVQNDERARQGLEPLEKADSEKVLVWPDLVYTELICMVALTAFLIVWAILITAPLEDPANRVKTPNPSKAPWYFLGLQEMLVYYDPWMAGVVMPSLIILGLMAIPYLDFNKRGNGYYTIEQRKFSYIIFQLGFLELWVTLIVLGTFLRGPNWNFFGPFEPWDEHKVLVLNNVDLSQMLWNDLLRSSLPKVTSDMSTGEVLWTILKREWLGLVLVLAYLLVLPPVLAATVFRKMFVKMGFFRYMLMCNLLLFMAALPIKMVLRWAFNLKYIVAIPEFFFNI